MALGITFPVNITIGIPLYFTLVNLFCVMEKLVTSEVKLGIIAGGQLGKMLVLAASNWNVQTYVT